MWGSKVSDYNIVKRTPYGKDALKALADECHKQGIKLFFYHSQLDWHHPDYYPLGGTGHWDGFRYEGGLLGRLKDGRFRLFRFPREDARPFSVAADRQGNIAYWHTGKIPIRSAAANPWLPALAPRVDPCVSGCARPGAQPCRVSAR